MLQASGEQDDVVDEDIVGDFRPRHEDVAGLQLDGVLLAIVDHWQADLLPRARGALVVGALLAKIEAVHGLQGRLALLAFSC